MFFFCVKVVFILEFACTSSTKFCWINRLQKQNELQEIPFGLMYQVRCQAESIHILYFMACSIRNF